jgi:uncharacterized protein (TIGR02265 family)
MAGGTVTQKQVFAVTIESALLRGMKGKLDAPLKQKLRAVDLDLDKLKPAYPLETYVKAMRIAAETGFPGVPRDEAYRRIGSASVRAFEETTVGKLLIAACRLLGPRRVLERAQTQFRSLTNYMRSTAKELGPTHYELWLSEVDERAAYYQGVIQTFLEISGAKNVQTRVARREGDSVTFDITWGG